MIEKNININKVFKEGFDVCHIDSGISSLSKQRILRLIRDDSDNVSPSFDELLPPVNGLLNEIEKHLMGVLKFFADKPGSIGKRINIHRVRPGQGRKFESLQWLQPAIGVALLMPEERESSFRISRIRFSKEGHQRCKKEIALISSHPKKIKVVVFNASSMIFSWEAPVNEGKKDQILLSILFEELTDV